MDHAKRGHPQCENQSLAARGTGGGHGESFIIAKAGKPLVKVVPLDQAEKPKRRIGFLKGRYQIPNDIKAIGREEIAAMFEGEG
jgi:antitoxin (DNA-binding transcriptional repressor) of toxin-antitoxin stability system